MEVLFDLLLQFDFGSLEGGMGFNVMVHTSIKINKHTYY